MRTREEAIAFCRGFSDVLEDYPFHDDNWTAMRHCGNKKIFALIFERDGKIWINVKCDTEWRDFWRGAHASVLPGYHMNKEQWISVRLDGSVTEGEIKDLIDLSYGLTEPKKKR